MCYVSTIGLSQIAAAQFLEVQRPRHWINCGQAGPLGWMTPAALGVCVADPQRKVVATSGDYAFENVNAPERGDYGVDHVAAAQGLGCKAIRVVSPEAIRPAFAQAKAWMEEHRVPVVVEIIVERVADVAMGVEIDAIREFESTPVAEAA